MILHLAFLASTAFAQIEVDRVNYTTPTKKLDVTAYPYFSDDYDMAGMETAIQRQLERFRTKDLAGTIRMGGVAYPARKAKESLQVFLQLVKNLKACIASHPKQDCYDTLNAEIRNRFNLFAPDLTQDDPRYGEENDSLFTAYHTQPIEAKSKPTGNFRYPIYRKPAGQSQYKTREEIDFKNGLKGKKLEIVYTDDLYDLYLLHVQGGGYVTINENGTTKNFYLSYSDTNDKKWTWISKYMIDKGYINNPSVAAQRKFLHANPLKHREIYSTCPSYVYFKTTNTPPVGSDTVTLTAGRSIATDHKLYGLKGMLAYIESKRPVEDGNYNFEEEDFTKIPFQPFSRFFLDQDTGGAIDGKGRADLYFGKSKYAYYSATYQQQTGKLRFLLLK